MSRLKIPGVDGRNRVEGHKVPVGRNVESNPKATCRHRKQKSRLGIGECQVQAGLYAKNKSHGADLEFCHGQAGRARPARVQSTPGRLEYAD